MAKKITYTLNALINGIINYTAYDWKTIRKVIFQFRNHISHTHIVFMVCCVIPYNSANFFCFLDSSDEIKLKTFSLDFLSPP